MNDKISKAVEDLLNTPKPPEPDKDELPKPFTFKDGKDPAGVPIERQDYVSASCKRCYGRGYVTYLVGDGYLSGPPGARAARQARDQRACPSCVQKGYLKARKAYDARVAEKIKEGARPEFAAMLAQVALGYADAETIAKVQAGDKIPVGG